MGRIGRAVGPPKEIYLTLDEAAEYCRVGKRTLQRYLAEGLLPYYRPGGGRRIVFWEPDLDAFLQQGRVEPRATERLGDRSPRGPQSRLGTDGQQGDGPEQLQ